MWPLWKRGVLGRGRGAVGVEATIVAEVSISGVGVAGGAVSGREFDWGVPSSACVIGLALLMAGGASLLGVFVDSRALDVVSFSFLRGLFEATTTALFSIVPQSTTEQIIAHRYPASPSRGLSRAQISHQNSS